MSRWRSPSTENTRYTWLAVRAIPWGRSSGVDTQHQAREPEPAAMVATTPGLPPPQERLAKLHRQRILRTLSPARWIYVLLESSHSGYLWRFSPTANFKALE